MSTEPYFTSFFEVTTHWVEWTFTEYFFQQRHRIKISNCLMMQTVFLFSFQQGLYMKLLFCLVFLSLIELKYLYVVLFCHNTDGELYSGTAADFMGRDFAIFRTLGHHHPIRTEQHDSRWLNGRWHVPGAGVLPNRCNCSSPRRAFPVRLEI